MLPFTCRLDFLSNHPSSSDSNDKLRREVGKSGSFLDDMTIFTLHITTTHYCTVSAQCPFFSIFVPIFVLQIFDQLLLIFISFLWLNLVCTNDAVSSLIFASNWGWWKQTKNQRTNSVIVNSWEEWTNGPPFEWHWGHQVWNN